MAGKGGVMACFGLHPGGGRGAWGIGLGAWGLGRTAAGGHGRMQHMCLGQ